MVRTRRFYCALYLLALPVHKAGFKLMPVGFFVKNPALDVPRN